MSVTMRVVKYKGHIICHTDFLDNEAGINLL